MWQHERQRWRNDYAWAYATERLATALAAWLRGDDGDRAIAAEHYALPEWDDVVTWLSTGLREHVQVKHQHGDFKEETLGAPLGMLVKWRRDQVTGFPSTENVRCVIAMPNFTVGVAQTALSLHGLHLLASECQKRNVTAKGLRSSGGHGAWMDWLVRRNVTSDDAETLRALPFLEVRALGELGNIYTRTEAAISEFFTDAPKARRTIDTWLRQESSPAGQLTPRDLWRGCADLRALARPQLRQWASYGCAAPMWTFDGTPAGSDAQRDCVKALWNGATPVHLNIAAHPGDPPRDALGRLAVHTPTASVRGAEKWRADVRDRTGGTLGLRREHDRPPGEHWTELHSKEPRSDADEVSPDFAQDLTEAMDGWVWSYVEVAIEEALASRDADVADDLRVAMSRVWRGWLSGPLSTGVARAKYLREMLATRSERDAGVNGTERLGPETRTLVLSAVRFHLAVAAALGEAAAEKDPFALRVIGLARFAPRARPRDVDLYLSELLPVEGPHVLLPQVTGDLSALDMQEDGLALIGLAHERIPRVTPSTSAIRRAMVKGLTDLRTTLVALRRAQAPLFEALAPAEEADGPPIEPPTSSDSNPDGGCMADPSA